MTKNKNYQAAIKHYWKETLHYQLRCGLSTAYELMSIQLNAEIGIEMFYLYFAFAASKEQEIICEVLFDEEFIDGLTIR